MTGKDLYEQEVNNANIHSNRMYAWDELTPLLKAEWNHKAAQMAANKAPPVEPPITPLDRDILDLFQEEGAETILELIPLLLQLIRAIAQVQKTASKVQRFGNVKNPFAGDGVKPNFELLEDELGDMLTLAGILGSRGIINKERVDARIAWKTGMLKTHGSIDWTKLDLPENQPRTLKDATDEDLAGPNFGGYVNKAPYQEMRLRQAMTGNNAPAEKDWVEALKVLNAFLRLTPEELGHRQEMAIVRKGSGFPARDFNDYPLEHQNEIKRRGAAILDMLFDRNIADALGLSADDFTSQENG
ncbi:hypothetical protein HOU03_gp211 [Caulobacter phage CcrSC]|uniref:Uncharacterized protein n=1 Tax=Caulobacter phage CcrSC TaxID=2283272 RepID=A0A385EGL1_9CAUD|nr:hypothetical protein HOU03_gp211 [Caulobacter phage CcrSC]AXQ70057.1 hypothetical protein CcrSC_gp475 [Caulobacter phage CcrSC]